MSFMEEETDMKKIITVLSACIFLLNFSSCTASDIRTDYSIKNALKISPLVYNENDGEDLFVKNQYGVYIYRVRSDFEFTQLKLNEVRRMERVTVHGVSIHLEFDGIIEVISEDKDVQLFFRDDASQPITYTTGKESYAFEHKLLNAGYTVFTPLGPTMLNISAMKEANLSQYYVGREYYLSVNAYKFTDEESPVIRAQLRLVLLEDKTKSLNHHEQIQIPVCYSIELISYEYRDMDKIMYEIWEDDEED
jgi:hypothetical protein